MKTSVAFKEKNQRKYFFLLFENTELILYSLEKKRLLQ